MHVAQHHAQFKKGRKKTEYRSYLQKDKSKFHQGVDKMHNKEALSDQETEAYYGSPQEINARSHQTALEFLKDSLDSGMTVEEIKQSVADNLQGYMENRFHKPNDRQRYALYKRFAKQVYQEVMREVDRLGKEENTPK